MRPITWDNDFSKKLNQNQSYLVQEGKRLATI